MAKHVWSVLCYKGLLDQYTNQVSLLDVIEAISIKPGEPVPEALEDKEMRVPVHLALVTLLTRSDVAVPEVGMLRVRLVLPDGVSRPPQEVKVDLTKHVRLRNFTTITSLPLRGDGYFYFVVELRDEASDEWKTAAEIPLEFKVEPFAPPAPVPHSAEKPARR
jgi:hypothetical protein